MPAEGRWTTWTDDQNVTHIARLDVPGNEGLENDFLSGNARRPTPEELQRAIAWTEQNPDWTAEVYQEMEADVGADRAEQEDTGTPAQGPRMYLDSRSGQVVAADHAPDPQRSWRLILDDGEMPDEELNRRVEASLAEGEPAIIVPSDFASRPAGEQAQITNDAVDEQYHEPRYGGPDKGTRDQGGAFWRSLLDLQRQWGVSPPTEGWPDDPAMAPLTPGPRSDLEANVELTGGGGHRAGRNPYTGEVLTAPDAGVPGTYDEFPFVVPRSQPDPGIQVPDPVHRYNRPHQDPWPMRPERPPFDVWPQLTLGAPGATSIAVAPPEVGSPT